MALLSSSARALPPPPFHNTPPQMSSGAGLQRGGLPYSALSKANRAQQGSRGVSPNRNIRLRHHGHTRMLFDMPGSATQGRGKGTRPACVSFSEQGVQRRGKCCGRGRPTLSDGAGTGQTAMNQEPVGRSQTTVSFCASFCICLKSLCCSTVCTSFFFFFPHSCQTTLISSHFNLGRIRKPTPPGEKPGLQGNNSSWLNYPILLRHKEFVCFAHES